MVCLDKVAYFTLGNKPKKRAVHDALFERELLKWIQHINQNALSDGDIILAVQSMLCAKSF